VQVDPDAIAFGLRREHFLIEIVAAWDQGDKEDGDIHRQWASNLSSILAPLALPGGYPNFLTTDDREQLGSAYGNNIARLQEVKRRFDPYGFFSATPLPI
jgi:Berberine and berberine like